MLATLAPDAELQHRTAALLRALAHQPWAGLEPVVLALALDPTLPTQVRAAAGWLVAGRASPVAREQASAWLLGRQQGEAEPAVLLALAAVAGRGGDGAHALRFVQAIEEEIRAYHASEPPPDPLAPRLDALPQRVQALSAAAAHAGAGPHIDRLVALLFEARYLPWAERVLHVTRLSFATPDALTALAPAPDPRGMRLETGEEEGSVLPPEVVQVAQGLKPLGDAALAQALTRVLSRTQMETFPDAWPAKLAALLHDPRSGNLEQAAAVLEAQIERLEPRRGPFDLALAQDRAMRAGRAGRFAEAARAARAARWLLACRGEEMHGGARRAWERLRAREVGWQACAEESATHAGPVPHDGAAARLEAEAQRAATEDAPLLAEIACAAARARIGLESAEAWARRALTLERRVEGEESLERTAALAEVLMARGRPGAAARRLGRALGDRTRSDDARYQLLLARALASHGDVSAARGPLRRALLAEPSLAAGLRDDPAFAAWAADGRLVRFVSEVEASRLAGEEE
jgi:tetratricopeptide (TPR) repeat protein